jgi:adenylate kinase
MGCVIALSGTPGTGKSAVGSLLAKQLDLEFIEIGQIIKDFELHQGMDPQRDTLIADINRLQEYLKQLLQSQHNELIISGHFADIIPDNFLKALIILRCHPLTLIDRLLNRGWTSEKILENIQAEILGECTSQALANHSYQKIFEINTTTLSTQKVAKLITDILNKRGNQHVVGKISWLTTLDPQLIHQIMEENQLPNKSQKA